MRRDKFPERRSLAGGSAPRERGSHFSPRPRATHRAREIRRNGGECAGPFYDATEISATSVRYHARDACAALCDQDEDKGKTRTVLHVFPRSSKQRSRFSIHQAAGCSVTTLGDLRSMFLNELPVVNEDLFVSSFLGVSVACFLQFP